MRNNVFLRFLRVNRSVGGATIFLKQHVIYLARTWRLLSWHVGQHVCEKIRLRDMRA